MGCLLAKLVFYHHPDLLHEHLVLVRRFTSSAGQDELLVPLVSVVGIDDNIWKRRKVQFLICSLPPLFVPSELILSAPSQPEQEKIHVLEKNRRGHCKI